ncbi:SDR family NAD(P)-dependent oxidoreductase [Sphingobium sp. HWE2-09]|uniref:SDR family NAD(P)-dependent oxidoreductase n=1 Tax=Sphingobium sp. HWE2-09 TaxID=3108390 RepID=UPI002DD23A9B|nr:SDR family NAD(P)-dependent oxidoreductase [Sphingobium sp. HWE2-09]
MVGILEGKVALVTGGARGLGREYALALAEAGAKVVVNDLGGAVAGGGADQEIARNVVDEIRAIGGTAEADGHSVADWAAAADIIATAVNTYGRLDIVVNNAGVSRFGSIDGMDEADWKAVLEVNLNGVVAVTSAATAHWSRFDREKGRAVINISSPVGLHPSPEAVAYSVAKAAIASFTLAVAPTLAPLGVKVNAVAPVGRSRMTDGSPQVRDLMAAPAHDAFDRFHAGNIAPLIVYLASPACAFTSRVWGIEGDDVFLFDGWSAEQAANNGGKRWTLPGLASAIAGFKPQDESWALWPGGRLRVNTPDDATFSF